MAPPDAIFLDPPHHCHWPALYVSSQQYIVASRSERRFSGTICAAALLGLGFLLLLNPATADWIPPCPFHALTGLQCPGCGSLRAIHNILHLHWAAALAYNSLTFLCLPFVGAWWLWHAGRAVTGRAPAVPFIRPALLWCIVAMVIIFGIVRNIPAAVPWSAAVRLPLCPDEVNLAEDKAQAALAHSMETPMGR